jgi:GTPase Era involved in 16S rRNA processing
MLLEPVGKSGPKGVGFDVVRSGDARIAMIGFPSVGKSTLLSKCTETESVVAGYEFTTLTCIPGKIDYNGAQIQLLDLPGIIEGASQGKGRGRQVIAVAKTADLILMMLDATYRKFTQEIKQAEGTTRGRVGGCRNPCKRPETRHLLCTNTSNTENQKGRRDKLYCNSSNDMAEPEDGVQYPTRLQDS